MFSLNCLLAGLGVCDCYLCVLICYLNYLGCSCFIVLSLVMLVGLLC